MRRALLALIVVSPVIVVPTGAGPTKLVLLSIVVVPFAQSAAMISAMPARMSGLVINWDRNRTGPLTTTRCGSHCTSVAPISVRASRVIAA